MDLLTHALLGATLALAAAPPQPAGAASAAGPIPGTLATRERLLLGAAGATFPDVDFVGFLVDPLTFLADWHQGPTHSLVLLPLWAALIAAAFVGARRRGDERGRERRRLFAAAASAAGLGLASHIAADLITAYGTMVLYPLSRWRASLGTTFVIDPLFTALVAGALVASLWRGRRWPARAGLLALAGYVSIQAGLQQQALDLAYRAVPAATQWAAFPQPFSPFNWKLIASSGTMHLQAHVNLAGHRPLVPAWPALRPLHDIAAAFRPPADLEWQARDRFGTHPERRAVAAKLWADERFAAFRRFATHPSLSTCEPEDGDGVSCVWFTDLRYDLPTLPDTFRYGFCREGPGAPWQLYRLRYFSRDALQRIG